MKTTKQLISLYKKPIHFIQVLQENIILVFLRTKFARLTHKTITLIIRFNNGQNNVYVY